MRYRGQVRNGVVVFEGNPLVAEGTTVEVVPVAPPSNAQHRPGSPQAMAELPHWNGPADELDRLLADVQTDRDADLTDDPADEAP